MVENRPEQSRGFSPRSALQRSFRPEELDLMEHLAQRIAGDAKFKDAVSCLGMVKRAEKEIICIQSDLMSREDATDRDRLEVARARHGIATYLVGRFLGRDPSIEAFYNEAELIVRQVSTRNDGGTPVIAYNFINAAQAWAEYL